MKLVWQDDAWEDYLYWQTQDKKTLRKINRLLSDIKRNGYYCSGKPEPLKGNLSGYWSVRIDEQNRIVFCINDDCAIAVWGALNELGFRVPEDYALIGFDDLPAAASLRLATIRKPQREVVESAVALLESKLKKQPAEVSRIFPAEFIPRLSCMKISAQNDKKGLVKA